MRSNRISGAAAAGFSLIELLVAMAIGLIVTLAITSVLIRGEGAKRSSTSVNDINQTGAYSAYVLDRAIRSAGSGFAQNWGSAYGCLLNVSQGSTAVLPLPAVMNAGSAFASVGSGASALPFRLAPVVIVKGAANNGGDVLIVMAGTGGVGEIGVPVRPPASAAGPNTLTVQNAVGVGKDDLLLLVGSSAAPGVCLMEQVDDRVRTDSSTLLPLRGSYFTASTAQVALTAFGSGSTAIHMGNAGSTTLNMPQFQLFGVGNDSTLFTYDLMQANASGALRDVPIADGVVEMRAIYGINSATPVGNVVDAWVEATGTDPTTGYSAATLTDGSASSQTKLRRIVAVRLGLILRTALAERPQDYAQPSGTTLTLFSDAVDSAGGSLKQTRTLSASELSYRFRTVELTIPLRNALLAP